MSPQICGQCANWNLKKSPLRADGFGLCTVEPNLALRAGRTIGPQFICRIGKFAQADTETLVRRERALA